MVGNKEDGEKVVIIVADWGDEKGQRYNVFDTSTMSYLVPFWCSGICYVRPNCIGFYIASELYSSRPYTYFFGTMTVSHGQQYVDNGNGMDVDEFVRKATDSSFKVIDYVSPKRNANNNEEM